MNESFGSTILEKLDRLLFPERCRRFITFRTVTVFVVLVAVGSTVLDLLNRPRSATTIRNAPGWEHNPAFILLHSIALGLGFWLLYWTRDNKQHYRLRVFLYGMLLGGLVAGLLDLLLPRV